MSLFIDLDPAVYCPRCEVIAVPGTCCRDSEPPSPRDASPREVSAAAAAPADEDVELTIEVLEQHPCGDLLIGELLTREQLDVALSGLRELLRTRDWLRRLEAHAARHGLEPCGNCGTRLWEWRTPLRCSECGEVRP